jgi:hypothetical protein
MDTLGELGNPVVFLGGSLQIPNYLHRFPIFAPISKFLLRKFPMFVLGPVRDLDFAATQNVEWGWVRRWISGRKG